MNAARFFMTSVHDSSLQEAWGRVMQSLMGPLYGPIEGLMSTFARVSHIVAFLVHTDVHLPEDKQHGKGVLVRHQRQIQRRG